MASTQLVAGRSQQRRPAQRGPGQSRTGRYAQATSAQMPDSDREWNFAELDHSEQYVARVAAVVEQHNWPHRSVNSDAGSAGGGRSANRYDKRGDDADAFRGPADPSPTERPKNLRRGRGQRRREREHMASAQRPVQDWSAEEEESAWIDSNSGRPSSCSPGHAESRGRADNNMEWRSSCSQEAGDSGDANDDTAKKRPDAAASGSDQFWLAGAGTRVQREMRSRRKTKVSTAMMKRGRPTHVALRPSNIRRCFFQTNTIISWAHPVP